MTMWEVVKKYQNMLDVIVAKPLKQNPVGKSNFGCGGVGKFIQ